MGENSFDQLDRSKFISIGQKAITVEQTERALNFVVISHGRETDFMLRFNIDHIVGVMKDQESENFSRSGYKSCNDCFQFSMLPMVSLLKIQAMITFDINKKVALIYTVWPKP